MNNPVVNCTKCKRACNGNRFGNLCKGCFKMLSRIKDNRVKASRRIKIGQMFNVMSAGLSAAVKHDF